MIELRKFRWIRVLVAITVAESLPILLLVAIVVLYALVSDQTQANSISPDEFAPIAGEWVGPIGGFVATMCLSWWAARVAPQRALSCGLAVGVGTAMLDLGLAVLIGGSVMSWVLVVSNCGRILAGLLGGVIASKRRVVQAFVA